jgi:hypothetical protein
MDDNQTDSEQRMKHGSRFMALLYQSPESSRLAVADAYSQVNRTIR